jgi:hypothetical protein
VLHVLVFAGMRAQSRRMCVFARTHPPTDPHAYLHLSSLVSRADKARRGRPSRKAADPMHNMKHALRCLFIFIYFYFIFIMRVVHMKHAVRFSASSLAFSNAFSNGFPHGNGFSN